MFKNVLIAEDHEIANLSLRSALKDLGVAVTDKDYVFYCDDAFTRIQKALRDGQPYELLITDLSFDDDYPKQQLEGGAALIKAAKHVQPNLKTLVFSAENRGMIADSLMRELDLDAYVPKARHDAFDLQKAIKTIYGDKKYLSPNLKRVRTSDRLHEFTAYDKTIISLLISGTSQKLIPDFLQEHNIKPAGLSSIEKRLSHIKTALNISTNEQLIAYCIENKVV